MKGLRLRKDWYRRADWTFDEELAYLIWLGWFNWHLLARLRAEENGVPGH